MGPKKKSKANEACPKVNQPTPLPLGLAVSPLVNYLKVKLRNRKSRLSKNQFDLTVRKDERFLLDLDLLLSFLNCKLRNRLPLLSLIHLFYWSDY